MLTRSNVCQIEVTRHQSQTRRIRFRGVGGDEVPGLHRRRNTRASRLRSHHVRERHSDTENVPAHHLRQLHLASVLATDRPNVRAQGRDRNRLVVVSSEGKARNKVRKTEKRGEMLRKVAEYSWSRETR